MKQVITKGLFIAGIALLTVPSSVLAQQKEKEKDNKKEKTVETIVINRENENDAKTIIEIDGDKIKVNGKEVTGKEDGVTVRRSKYKTNSNYAYGFGNAYSWDGDRMSFFNEDENRAMLGVTTEGDAKGAEVVSVTKESAAEKAGLKKGDIITKIGDKSIESSDDVTEAVRAHKPGDKVALTFLRDSKEQKATAELTKWKGIALNGVYRTIPQVNMGDLNRVEAPFFNNWNMAGNRKLGLSIQDTDDSKGVKVLEVEGESNAAKAGIQKDDIILSVDDKEIKSTEDVTRSIRENREKYTFNFKIQRGGKTQNVEVKMPKKLRTTDL